MAWTRFCALVSVCAILLAGCGGTDPPLGCGNGVLDTGEECDDSNTSSGDGCSSSCENEGTPMCGDAILQVGEQCDDGQANSDVAPDACRTTCVVAACGDGVADSPEECDDGALNSDTLADACRTSCVDPGCGDRVIDTGEQCDDGPMNSDTLGDACRTTCVAASCGDDVVDSAEECDDGPMNSDTAPDACRTSCLAPSCGDSVTDPGNAEECDDGPLNSDVTPDACRTTCHAAGCGDGVVDSGEPCDDGVLNSDVTPDACRTTCALPSCGDAVTDTGEQCDDGMLNSDVTPDACRTTCTTPVCGDAVADPAYGEQCDDANTVQTDACLIGCFAASCGDGLVHAGVEACDDGNGVLTDACPDGPLGTCQAAFCGDGFRRASSEQCDDGNTLSGDGCSSLCFNEAFSCGDGVVQAGEACDAGGANSDTADGACRMNCTAARCGDLVVDYSLGEQCDDGNVSAGDGCGATCQVEAPATCGDGVLDLATGEQCDDGGTAAGDGCDPACQFETVGGPMCGNGMLESIEICDDMNTANGDACNPTCNLTNTSSLFAGTVGVPGTADGVGAAAQFSGTAALAVDATTLWVGDGANGLVRRVDIATADVVTIAGSGTPGWLDDPIGLNAQFREMGAIATDGITLWIADQGNHLIRAIDLTDPNYPVTTVAGQPGVRGAADGIGSAATLDDVRGLTYYAGNVYFVDACRATIRRFDPASNAVVTVAGSALPASCAGGSTVNGYGASARFISPRYMASDNSGMLYIADTNGNLIRSYNTLTGYVGTFVGSGACGYVDAAGASAAIHRPRGMTSDGTSVYWVEFNAHTVRQAVFATASVSTLVGTPPACAVTCSCGGPVAGGYLEGVGAASQWDNPWSMTFHYPSNSLFVFDGGNNVIRRIQ